MPATRGVFRRAMAARHGKLKSQNHAQRHRLAMQQGVGIAGQCLKGVSECMAQIEECTLAAFALVAGDNMGF